MASLSSIDGLENHFKIDSIGLISDHFYSKLNHNDNNLEDYDRECKTLLSGKQHFTYNKLCKKLLRFLKNSSSISNKKDYVYDDCILFNYWIYNNIAQKKNYDYNKKVIPAFAELQTIWNSLIIDKTKESYYNKCKPDFYIATQDDWEKRKQLYDYCVNYESLSATAGLFQNSCKYIYSYIKSNASLYDYFNKRCKQDGNYKCPDFYSKCKKYDPVIVLSNLPCNKDMHNEQPTAAEKALHEKSRPDMSPNGTLPSDDLRLKNASSPPLTKAGDVLLGVVATTMTSGALYKFTPLGNMLRNRFGWNNNMRNFNGGDNGLFDYAPESFNPFSGGAEEHYIGYHPA